MKSRVRQVLLKLDTEDVLMGLGLTMFATGIALYDHRLALVLVGLLLMGVAWRSATK